MRTRRRLVCACALAGWLAGCGSEPPPPQRPPPAPPPAASRIDAPIRRAPPKPRDRSAEVAKALGVDTADLIWSPARKTFAAALPDGHLAVHGVGGDPRGQFQTHWTRGAFVSCRKRSARRSLGSTHRRARRARRARARSTKRMKPESAEAGVSCS